MPTVLIATEQGCQVLGGTEENALELAERKVGPLAVEADSACLAIVEDNQIWRRSADSTWSDVATVNIKLQSIMSYGGTIFCGGMDEAAIVRISRNGRPELLNSFAVTVIDNEAIFSVQDGPFAKRSQLWRWQVGSQKIEAVRDGLPEWFEGKIDTSQIAAGSGRVAVVDGGGNLWLSTVGSSGWKHIAKVLPSVLGIAIL